jgi:O-antigen ligase
MPSIVNPTRAALFKLRREVGQVRPDATTVLTAYAILLYVVPSDRRIAPLGGAGSLASLLATAALLWWGWHQINTAGILPRPKINWVRVMAFAFFFACSASYAASALSPLPAADASVADLGLVRVAALVGILLVANDGIDTEARLLLLARRLCMLGALYAGFGLVQFFTGMSFIDAVQIPGLSSSSDAVVGARNGFVRPVSTAMHPLEYSVVLTMILPLALALAVHDNARAPLRRWIPVLLLTTASALSVTRSALLATLTVFLVLLPSWPAAMRRILIVAAGLGSVAMYVTVPGMASTVVAMFTEEDPSVTSRTDSYDVALSFFAINPVFGRGFGTFLPAYRIVDNQYLLSAIEVGVVGLAALMALILAAIILPLKSRHHWQQQPMHGLGPALFASMLAGGMVLAFFDAFAFTQACGTLFLVIGLCGAYSNISGGRPAPLPGTKDGR